MAQDTRKDETRKNGELPPFRKFEEFVKRIAAVPKEELDEQRAEYEREKKEKRAG